ncbi:hypothetical protein N8494_01590 [bacterium]|nr:hypothetical protein [bacterium]
MRQILHSLRNGETCFVDVPQPRRVYNGVQIRLVTSLVSLRTEKMLIDFGRSGWIAKAKQQPEKVRKVIQKIKSDGISVTLRSIDAKLDHNIPLGYSNVGRVIDVG